MTSNLVRSGVDLAGRLLDPWVSTGKALSARSLRPWDTTVWGGSDIPYDYHIKANSAYEKAIVVRECIYKIQSTAGMADFEIKQLKGGKYMDAPEDHPLRLLLERPNKKLSSYDLKAHTVARLHLEGNCFWYLQGPTGGRPERIQIIPSRYLTIHANPDNGMITRYVYRPFLSEGGTDLHPDSMIHLRMYNPNSQFWGLSTLSAAMIEVSSDYAMAQWNQNFFGPRNAIPNMAIEFQGNMRDEEFQRAVAEWRQRGGINRETMFFRSGMGVTRTNIHNFGLTPIEAAFLEGRQWTGKSIRNLFRVPDPEGTEASSITQERHYYQSVHELMTMVSEQLTLELAPFWNTRPRQFRIKITDNRPVNEELKLKQIETASSHLSINEVRSDFYDKEEVSWGDGPSKGAGTAYIQFGMQGMSDMPMSGNQPDNMMAVRDQMRQGRDAQNNPPPGQEPAQQFGRSRQSRGVLDRERLVKAQKSVLAAWDSKQSLEDALQTLDEDIQGLVAADLGQAQARDDILRAFDPLFAAAKASEGMIRQIRKLGRDERRDVMAAIDMLNDMDLTDHFDGVLNVPDEVWDALPEATL